MQMSRKEPEAPLRQINALTELQALAADRASRLGHELEAWETPPTETQIGLSSSCRRCGRTVYVRAEPGLGGIAGRAVRERCPDVRPGATAH
jgi:hypothetical protein